ncbi:S8 family peptidase [Lacticaseibacillus paracasei]|uniref:S8 family peptidase n=1 Tax=Lacticaseibacillus paracasei TaxID=1597 RepID=UPI0021A649A2|nr:S8 family peptidase [Lacticaseibacillus paracasei]MCT3338118.1 hypothetical protein [Lacticaseibacillus paracasei]
MDNHKQHRYMIQNGDVLRRIAPDVVHGFSEKELLRSLEASRDFINHEVLRLESEYKKANQKNLLDEIFVAFDYPKTYVAKSYQISSLYKKSGLTVVGTADWQDPNSEMGRCDIVRGTIEAFRSVASIAQDTITNKIKDEIDRVWGIELLSPLDSVDSTIRQLSGSAEMVELSFFDVPILQQLLMRLDEILQLDKPLNEDDIIQVDGALYLYLKLNVPNIDALRHANFLQAANLQKLDQFNPLRSAAIATARDIYSAKQCPNNLTYIAPSKPLPVVGLIDGGVDFRGGDFLEFVHEAYSVDALPSNLAREHGTSVASVLMYGELPDKGGQVTPDLAVESVRVLPSEIDELMLSLVDLDNILREAIPELSQIKIWNISVGPKGPVIDDHIGSLTAILDKLAFQYNVLFVVAVGNTGQEQGIARRMQTPADAVNNLAVTAFTNLFGGHQTSAYASIGPGREGGKMKPDISGHGGTENNDVVLTVSTSEWFLNEQQGTSFAAPLVARLLAMALWRFPELSVLDLRATVTQYLALNFDLGRDIYHDSKGELSSDVERLIEASPNEFRIKYSGELTAGSNVLMNIPIPEYFQDKTIELTWTIAVKTDVDPSRPDAYTKFGIEDTLYPDADKYSFYNKETKKVRRQRMDNEDAVQVLLEHGFTRGQQPVAHDKAYLTTPYSLDSKDEASRRRQLKWDTVKSQKLNVRVKSLNRPFIKLHALSRDASHERVSYSLVLSIRSKNDLGLYQRMLNSFPQLIPIIERVDSGRV